jgi:hypothetical protein
VVGELLDASGTASRETDALAFTRTFAVASRASSQAESATRVTTTVDVGILRREVRGRVEDQVHEREGTVDPRCREVADRHTQVVATEFGSSHTTVARQMIPWTGTPRAASGSATMPVRIRIRARDRPLRGQPGNRGREHGNDFSILATAMLVGRRTTPALGKRMYDLVTDWPRIGPRRTARSCKTTSCDEKQIRR